MALTQIDDRGLKTPIDLLDNEKIRFGTGNDLELYHDGTRSWVRDSGSGNLIIDTDGSEIDINSGGNAEYMARFIKDGSVELYYNNAKKFETTSTGGTLTGHLNATNGIIIRRATAYASNDADELIVGDEGVNANQGITILAHTTKAGLINFGDGDNPYGVSRGSIKYDHADDSLAFSTGATERLNITSTGNVSIPNDSGKFTAGAGSDLQVYYDGTHSRIVDNGANATSFQTDELRIHDAAANEYLAKFVANGANELYYDNSKKFHTDSAGAVMGGRLQFDDNNKATFGTSGDLQIYHDGSNSWVKDTGQGALVLDSDSSIQVNYNSGAENMAKFWPNGSVELYYDNSKKFETLTSGTHTYGHSYHNDNHKVILGTGEDLNLFHDGTNSHIQNLTGELKIHGANTIRLQNPSSGETYLLATNNGAVELYYDNNKTFETQSDGVRILGDSKIWFDAWQGRFDRNWDDYPSITITPSTTYGSNQGEFRFHGQSGSLGGYGSGSDFALDVRTDGTFETGSDRRRKTNIEEITGALATVKQLTGKKFNIINRQGDLDPNKGTKKQFGLIAQECEDIIPEVVTFHPDENTPNENGWCSAYGLDYGQLTPLLINAIKELAAKVETLETKVAALESS